MARKQVDLLQGTLDLLVLKSLALGPLHGLGVSNRTDHEGNFQRQARVTVPVVTPDGRGGLAPGDLGRVREQSPCKVLSPYCSRSASVRCRSAGLATHCPGDHHRPKGHMRRRSRAVDSSPDQPLAQPVPQ